MTKTKWVLAAAVLLLAASLSAYFLRPPEVHVLVLQPTPLVRTLQFSARVASLSRVDIGSTITGRVKLVKVREGAQVQQGDVLVQLETDELKAGLGQAVAAEQQAVATVQAAHTSWQRAQQLVAQNFYSAAQVDEAKRALDVAQAQQVAARAAVVAAKARLEQAQLRAPADAKVLSRMVEPGQIVQAGRALMSLSLAGPTQLTAQVDERFLDQLQVGQSAMVVADAFAQTRLTARVLSIAPVVDAQRGAIEVKFALDQTTPAFLREDMTLSVEVQTGQRDKALAVPLSALASAANKAQALVWVVKDGQVQSREVRLGLRTLDAVELLQGVAPGEAVALQSGLQAGQRVRAQAVSWQPGPGAAGGGAANAAATLTGAIAR